MSKRVESSDGLHRFCITIAPSVNEQNISTYHTCIACGERRALLNDGRLIRFDAKQDLWVGL